MAKNKKRQYHRPQTPKHSVYQKPVRVSQCMIVKNEEKNIERALTWGKGFVFEQIVVDTGSTDRTVEIATSMGAKVYHFEWIDDFSAAKNYAISLASGDWIAFLDADEYFPEEDVKRLAMILRNVQADPTLSKMKTSIRCPIANVDDAGKPFSVLKQDRIFRNALDEVYYTGRIHEYLYIEGEIMEAPELTVIHTGYSTSVYAETNKAERNVKMIREELDKDPEDPELMCYLADSLRVEGALKNVPEAEGLYRKAIASTRKLSPQLRQNALNFLIAHHYEDKEFREENLALCKQACAEFPGNPDFLYYYARRLHDIGDFKTAWDNLLACEAIMKTQSLEIGSYVIKNAMLLFFQMVLVAEELGNVPEVIRCATLVLKEDKNQPLMLAPYINAFKRPGYETPTDEVFAILSKLYDFNNVKDKITVMRAANTAKDMELVKKVLETFTQEELGWLTADMSTGSNA